MAPVPGEGSRRFLFYALDVVDLVLLLLREAV